MEVLIGLKGGSSTFNHVITDEKSLRADCAQVEWLEEYLLALRYRECPSSACRFRPFRSLEKITEISLKEYHNNAYSHKRARYLEIHLLTWKDLMNEWHNTHDESKKNYRSCPLLAFEESNERDDFDRKRAGLSCPWTEKSASHLPAIFDLSVPSQP